MKTYNLIICSHTATLRCSDGREQEHSISGPHDPRLTLALTLCRQGGFDISVVRAY